METIKGNGSYIPAVAFLFKFTFDVKNNEYLESNGWSQSEMSASVAWRQFNETVNAVSAGVDVNLGLKDEAPPVIQLWLGDDDATPVQTIPVAGDEK